MRGFIFLTILGTLLLGCGRPRPDDTDTAMLLPETIGDWVKDASPVTYDRETIFDYINGAGEVYRSYAFERVVVARYQSPEGLGIAVELFDMGKPDDAYGVFSYAREQEEAGIGSGFERRGSILCFWQDRYYVCAAAEHRDPDPGPLLEEMAKGVARHLPAAGERPALVDLLPVDGLIPLSERFFHNHQTLNYHYYLVRENVLNLSSGTDAVLGRYRPGSSILLIVEYGAEEAATEALASFRHFIAQNSVSANTVGEVPEGESDQETMNTEHWKYVSSTQKGRFVVCALNGDEAAQVEALMERASGTLVEIGD